jgi:hypothetical protein
MRFPDFVPAKREEVPDYISAAYLQSRADQEAAEQNRLNKQDKWKNFEALNTGVSDAMGPGKSPLGSVLRMGKDAWTKHQNTQSPWVNPDGAPKSMSNGQIPGGPPSKEVLMSDTYMPNRIDVKSAMTNPQRLPDPSSFNGGSRGGSAMGDAVRSASPGTPAVTPAITPAITPAATGVKEAAALPDFLKGTGIDVGKALGNIGGGAPPQAAAAATQGAEKLVSNAVAPNIASKVVGDAAGKGLGGAFAAAGGAAVPGLGAAAGAIPAALRGDMYGAVKGGVGGAAGSTLMAAGPAMAAAGPVGWAGMAGLAALSLYGMLG